MANYRVSKNINSSNKTAQDKTNKKQQKQSKMNHFQLLTLKHEFLKISISLQTAFAAETHVAEVQWPEEQVNMLKSRMFRVGT
jgi:hypothetical protein